MASWSSRDEAAAGGSRIEWCSDSTICSEGSSWPTRANARLRTAPNSLAGSSRGRNGSITSHRPASRRSCGRMPAHQRRLPAAGGSEHHHEQPLVEAVNWLSRSRPCRSPRRDRRRSRHLPPETPAAPVRWAGAVPIEGVRRVEARRQHAGAEPAGASLSVDREVDDLTVRQHAVDVAVVDLDREKLLAQRARMSDLHEAPARGHGVVAAQHEDRTAGSDLPVKLLFPSRGPLVSRRPGRSRGRSTRWPSVRGARGPLQPSRCLCCCG